MDHIEVIVTSSYSFSISSCSTMALLTESRISCRGVRAVDVLSSTLSAGVFGVGVGRGVSLWLSNLERRSVGDTGVQIGEREVSGNFPLDGERGGVVVVTDSALSEVGELGLLSLGLNT